MQTNLAEKCKEDSLCLGRLGSLGSVLAGASVGCAIGAISCYTAVIVRMYQTTEFEIQTVAFFQLTSATFLFTCISEIDRQRFIRGKQTNKEHLFIQRVHQKFLKSVTMWCLYMYDLIFK